MAYQKNDIPKKTVHQKKRHTKKKTMSHKKGGVYKEMGNGILQ